MAADLINQANEEYVKENYAKAVDLYTEALAIDKNRDDIYYLRAQTNMQLGKLADSVIDCDKAIELNENNEKAVIKKGSILFQLGEVQKAEVVFKEGQKKFSNDTTFEEWLSKVQQRMKELGLNLSSGPVKLKFDWYQTHSHVIVTVLMKNVNKDDLTVDVDNRMLHIAIKSNTDTPSTLDFTLAHEVAGDKTITKVFSTKIEIKLKKVDGIQWSKLEGSLNEEQTVLPSCAAPAITETSKYPTSSPVSRDWDKLAAEVTEEEKNEKLEGDAGLNQFFQKIYADATEDTKRAMMKSFSESGGTVLSTNWNEVGSKKVDVKPPDGMEYKNWEN